MDDHESFMVGANTMEAVTKAMNHIIQQDPEINQAAALSGVLRRTAFLVECGR